MQQLLSLRIQPHQFTDAATVYQAIAAEAGCGREAVTGYYITRYSLDARSKTIWINLQVQAFIDEPYQERPRGQFQFRDVSQSQYQVVIAGAGPAGLFAALHLLEAGIRPIVIERGKDVRSRRRDLAKINREGAVNPESNYCFGEGGAGTYSDGKLYTRSSKRGNIDRILQLFVHFGAEERILYEAHPHIGTNKLPHIITAMRTCIEAAGGRVLFEKKLTGFHCTGNELHAVQCADGDVIQADALILATGHSARDIFRMLHQQQLQILAKPLAIGVRVEHPQELIDQIQYKLLNGMGRLPGTVSCPRPGFLPPAAYSLVEQVHGAGVFSFCMCPGGIIAPAATAPGEIVVNGWSPSKRNNPFANSGMVVQTELADVFREKTFKQHSTDDPLIMLQFQEMVEQNCFRAGGGNLVAPAQRMPDMSNRRLSATLPNCSYQPGLKSVELENVLPGFIYRRLADGFREFGKKMPGYYTSEATVVATESRTSSPVRIPRNNETLAHPQVSNLYPCGEGAGYAGGIVSAAMDGERVAAIIEEKFRQKKA